MGLFDAISGLFRKKAQQGAQKLNHAQTAAVVEQKPKRSRAKKAIQTGEISLGEWKAEMDKLQNHPLTQAKIINGQLLNAIYSILEQISTKIDSLSVRLEKIESMRVDSHVKHDKKNQALREFEAGLSSQERKILELIKKKKAKQASDVADALDISRSNASLKMNKLFDMGMLDKEKEGKDTLYRIK
ncbi:MAG: helix-turn-helix transcriptional regulator [DPANN group archaeon]|nr:helix-turn-helix transcriptional regulator [DPANN group archaeon]